MLKKATFLFNLSHCKYCKIDNIFVRTILFFGCDLLFYIAFIWEIAIVENHLVAVYKYIFTPSLSRFFVVDCDASIHLAWMWYQYVTL